MLLVNKEGAVLMVTNYALEQSYLYGNGLKHVEADGKPGDYFIDGQLIKRPGHFWSFDSATNSFMFDRNRWSAAENKKLVDVVRNLNLQYFPDTEKCGLVQLAAADLRKAIDDAETDIVIEYEKEILAVVG